MTSFASTLMSLSAAITTVKNAWDTWNNDNISLPDKLL
jgi:hypothetical protein